MPNVLERIDDAGRDEMPVILVRLSRRVRLARTTLADEVGVKSIIGHIEPKRNLDAPDLALADVKVLIFNAAQASCRFSAGGLPPLGPITASGMLSHNQSRTSGLNRSMPAFASPLSAAQQVLG